MSSSKSKKKSSSKTTQIPKLQSSSSSCSTQLDNNPPSEIDLVKALEEASTKFPSFITTSALTAQLSEFDSSQHQKGSIIWLSQSSMLSSSISPSSLVSVSLAPVDQNSTSNFPLRSLPVECSDQFGVDWHGNLDDKAGNYFTIATAFPSSKLVKNGVQISLNLLYSLGCPVAGRYVFVQPIHVGPPTGLVNGNGNFHSSSMDFSSVNYCKELYIRLLPLKSASRVNMNASLTFENSIEKTLNRHENGNDSSPRTPSLERSRLPSPSPSKLSSLGSKDVVSSLNDIKRPYFDTDGLEEVLRDNNANKLLQRTVVYWLCSRTLLSGNLVAIPLLSRLYLFEVMGLKSLSSDRVDRDPIQTSLVHCNNEALIISLATKVNICSLSDVPLETPAKSSSTPGEIESNKVNNKMEAEVTKLGGLLKEYTLLRDIIAASSKNALSSLGLRTTKGVLLHGPPGTGKTSLAQLCAHDAGVNLFKVNGPEIVSQYYGESEQGLHNIFKSASEAAPSVVFIDELDAIAPARKEGGEELSQRMVATLLNLMDGISRTDGLLVIAATNRLECIEPALRRPGRLDREIEIGVPSPDQRLDILTTLLCKMEHSLSFAQIQQLSVVTHGFVGADLATLSNEAAMVCLRRCIHSKKPVGDLYSNSSNHDGSIVMTGGHYARDGMELFPEDHEDSSCSNNSELTVSTNSVQFPISGEASNAHDSGNLEIESYGSCSTIDHMLKINFEDFEKARMKIRPSAMREVILEVPKVKWEDVGGQEEVKAQLMEAVEWPQKHKDAFQRIGTRPPTGVLMFGPPGCSKTLMARAVASEARLNFLSVKGPELFSKWVGESEKAVRSLFAKARANAPSIIFFDEIDSLAVIRGKESDGVSVADRVMSQLLVELDGLHERVDVTVIAATNRPDKIDPALLRPGRFDRLLYVGPPSETDRVKIFNVHLRKMPCSSSVNVRELAHLTEGCTGADIALVCREAAISAIEENLNGSEIKMEHLKNAIFHVRPSEIQPYQGLSAKFQRLVYSKSESDDLVCQHQLNEPNMILSRNPMKWIIQLACSFLASVLRRNSS